MTAPGADSALLAASCRVALAALLHDLGKPAERARIAAQRPETEIHEYCPRDQDGRSTHIHAAYTAVALEQLAARLPLTGPDCAPFAPPGAGDDTLLNAAARHHKPAADSLLQQVVTTADRLASGFERTPLGAGDDNFAAAPENYRSARLWPLLERLRLPADDHPAGPAPAAPAPAPAHRYRLLPLSAASIFPVTGPEPSEAESEREYRVLWEGFVAALKTLPAPGDAALPAWLDAFDSLLACYWTAIPAATYRVEPDVSLYDHSRTTAALAVGLWRYHHDRGDDARETARRLAAGGGRDEPKFLLVQAETSGIQEFLFAAGGETQRRAAQLLRGRSAYVALAAECAALAALDRLSLPPTSQVLNAAGKILIVAPNTPLAVAALEEWRASLDRWSLEHTFGQLHLNACWRPAAARDFLPQPFAALTARLAADLAAAKLQPFNLCAAAPPPPVFAVLGQYGYGNGVCSVDGRAPAEAESQGARVCPLCRDQIRLGQWLAASPSPRLALAPAVTDAPGERLGVELFGYRVHLDAAGPDPRFARQWDLALPSGDAPVFTALARRALNAFVPRFTRDDAAQPEKYGRLRDDPEVAIAPGAIEYLDHLAYEDRTPPAVGESDWRGVALLGALKGDVDRLGRIFQVGTAQPSFAKLASLSRQISQFFSLYLPVLCAREFPRAYTVFAGGDDFFLLGPWHSQLRLAARLRREFARYTAGNPDLHFSAALSLAKPGLPIRTFAAAAEDWLHAAKAAGRNRLACFGQILPWADAPALLDTAVARLGKLQKGYGLSTGYLYSLLQLCDWRAELERNPRRALWHSQFYYRTSRWITDRLPEAERADALGALHQFLVADGIEAHRERYRIPLSIHLYQQRVRE